MLFHSRAAVDDATAAAPLNALEVNQADLICSSTAKGTCSTVNRVSATTLTPCLINHGGEASPGRDAMVHGPKTLILQPRYINLGMKTLTYQREGRSTLKS